jgi:hypothetical protein
MKQQSPWYQENPGERVWFNDTYLTGDGTFIYASVYQVSDGWEYSIWDNELSGSDARIERGTKCWKTRETTQRHADKALERCAAKRALIKMLQGE